MSTVAVTLLALAVSIDGLGVGLACGLGQVRLPLTSLLLLGMASGLAMLASMGAGSLVASLLTPRLTAWLGGLLLIGFGLFMLHQQGKREKRGLMGLLDHPAQADRDRSGTISISEGMVLGVALALDAFGAGFGAALAGYPPVLTAAVVAAAKIVLVGGGFQLGQVVSGATWIGGLKSVPGLIICTLGVVKIFLL